MDQLNVDISVSKSIEGTTDGLKVAEFCKNVFKNGENLSNVPPGILMKLGLKGKFAPQLQNELEKRGYLFDEGNCLWKFFGLILSRHWYINLLLINGMPTECTGLRRALPNWAHPRTIASVVGPSYGISTSNWIQISKFLRVHSAIKSTIKRFNETLGLNLLESKDGIKSLLYFAGKPPLLDFYRFNESQAMNENRPVSVAHVNLAWPLGLDQLEKLRDWHPSLSILYTEVSTIIDAYFGKAEGMAHIPWDSTNRIMRNVISESSLFNKSANLAHHVLNIVPTLKEDPLKGISPIAHVKTIVSIIRRWIVNPDLREITYTSALPYTLQVFHVSVDCNKDIVISLGSKLPRVMSDAELLEYMKEQISVL